MKKKVKIPKVYSDKKHPLHETINKMPKDKWEELDFVARVWSANQEKIIYMEQILEALIAQQNYGRDFENYLKLITKNNVSIKLK